MSSDNIKIHKDLLQLKPFDSLDSISMSRLARMGTSVLRQVVSTTQAMAINIQGHGAMVTMSQRQYDEMIKLIQSIKDDKSPDHFIQSLNQEFDALVEKMSHPTASQSTDKALFGEPEALNETYRPGVTETKP